MSDDTDKNFKKPTGWPRPGPKIGKPFGLNRLRMGILIGLALGGTFGGYYVGRFVRPAPPPATVAADQKPAPVGIAGTATDNGQPHAYEQQLPRNIVVEQNGVLVRLALPEPGKTLDFGVNDTPDEAKPEVAKNPASPAAVEPATDQPPAGMASSSTGGKPTAKSAPPLEVASRPAARLVRAIEQTQTGADAPPPWLRYVMPVTWSDKPKIVIVIDDLGLDRPRTRRTMALPGPLTLSFLAYADDLAQQTQKAHAAGHELMLHVPMEPGAGNIDPGPNVLLSGMSKDELLKSLRWNLDQMQGYVGINNHMGSRFTADSDAMQIVVGELRQRGLLFLDSVTSGKSVAHNIARDAGIPFAIRNVFLDHDDDEAAIRRQLNQVERIARQTGLAIAIGHPREKTLNVLDTWLKSVAGKGFQLVPVSSVARVAAQG